VGVKNWGSKIAAKQEDVVSCLRKFARHKGGKFEESDQNAHQGADNICLMVAPLGDFTAIGWHSMGLVPQLVLYLSKELGTRVISVDEQENACYQHFSELDHGKVVRLLTKCSGDQGEEVNIPNDYLIDIAKRKESPGFRSAAEKVIEKFAFDLLLSEHDMQGFPAEGLLDSSDAKFYEVFVKGLGQERMGSSSSASSTDARFWTTLTSK
jgi:hypothetical protein